MKHMALSNWVIEEVLINRLFTELWAGLKEVNKVPWGY